jgi:hypothetical protein
MRKFRRHWSHKVTKEKRAAYRKWRKEWLLECLKIKVPRLIQKMASIRHNHTSGVLRMERYKE